MDPGSTCLITARKSPPKNSMRNSQGFASSVARPNTLIKNVQNMSTNWLSAFIVGKKGILLESARLTKRGCTGRAGVASGAGQ